MTRYLDYTALRDFLEESLKDKKEEIMSLNKYCRDGKSFLASTYDITQILIKDNVAKYRIIVFQDLPFWYTDLISENIKSFMDNNKLEYEYTTLETFEKF